MNTRPAARKASDCVIGADIGAGALKISVVDADGRELGSASQSYATSSPRQGWSEQNPEDWWRAFCDCVPRALEASGIAAADVRAISFSAGAHTPVLLDAQDRLVRPAILWSDQRSGNEARALEERLGDEILKIALNRPTATWTLPQLMWLRHHEPESARATRRLMLPKDWLRWRLTGTWHTDVTDAVGTLMWDNGAERWSPLLCDAIGWDAATLPPAVAPTAVTGTVTAEAAAACGLAEGTACVCGTSDTSVEAFGAGAAGPGDAVVKLATAATVCVIGAAPHVHPSLINYPFAIPGLWYTITATNSCASAHRWLRDRFFLSPGQDGAAAFAEMDRLATEVPAGSNGLLFHPYLLGERAPHWDPLLRADFLGATMRHDRGHFVRALYEGIAFSVREVLDVFRARQIAPSRARIIGGGARSALWRQIVADILNIEITLPATTDASYGAALLAGVAAGFFSDERDAVRRAGGARTVHRPDPARAARYDTLYDVYRDAGARLKDINHRLSAFEAGTANDT